MIPKAVLKYTALTLGLVRGQVRGQLSARLPLRPRNNAAVLGKPDACLEVLAPEFKEEARQRANQLEPVITELRGKGLSLAKIAGELNRRKVPTPRGGNWDHSSVRNVMPAAGGLTPTPQRERSGRLDPGNCHLFS